MNAVGLIKENEKQMECIIRCTKQSIVQQMFRLEQEEDVDGSDTTDVSLDCKKITAAKYTLEMFYHKVKPKDKVPIIK